MSLFKAMNRCLEARKSIGKYRCLLENSRAIDFSSNDYLGLSYCSQFTSIISKKAETEWKIRKCLNNQSSYFCPSGSGGSRLLAGHHEITSKLEKKIAHHHDAPSGLIFNSGFDANVGFFSCVPQKMDFVLYDELIHASVHDGLKLSRGKGISFPHNNLQKLEEIIWQVKDGKFGHFIPNSSSILVAVESVYSMDGNICPLKELVELCEEHENCHLVVDEAHSTGVYGSKGEGLVHHLGLSQRVFARIHTFGKALGSHGAVVVGSNLLKDYLINYSRPLIYSTSLPYHSLCSIQCAYEFLSTFEFQNRRKKLFKWIEIFQQQMSKDSFLASYLLPSNSPIQGIVIGDNEKCLEISKKLAD
eukprot:Sdes_comp20181_c0_seq2m13440